MCYSSISTYGVLHLTAAVLNNLIGQRYVLTGTLSSTCYAVHMKLVFPMRMFFNLLCVPNFRKKLYRQHMCVGFLKDALHMRVFVRVNLLLVASHVEDDKRDTQRDK